MPARCILRYGILLVLAVGCTGSGMMYGGGIPTQRNLMRSLGKEWKAVKKNVKAGDNRAAGRAAGKLVKLARKIPKVFKYKDTRGRARPSIWENKKVFERKGRFLAVSAAVFSQIHSRSKSKARVVKAMRNIGKNCGGCHKPFRAPKKKKT